MRQIILTIILISTIQIVSGQDFKYLKPNIDDSCVIINKIIDTVNHYEQLVYIDYKRKSKLKESVADFNLTNARLKQVSQTYDDIVKKEKMKIKKFKNPLPSKWIKINKYKGNWTLYDDIEFNTRYILTDSSLIIFDMDGLYSNVITDLKYNKKDYKFTLLGLTWGNPQSISEYTLNIKIINKDRMITLWEINRDGQIYYSLMIPESKKTEYPIIGIITTDLMGDESKILDEINYKVLK